MSDPAACAGTEDGLHHLELEPLEDGSGFKAKCKGCGYYLSKEEVAQVGTDAGFNRDRKAHV